MFYKFKESWYLENMDELKILKNRFIGVYFKENNFQIMYRIVTLYMLKGNHVKVHYLKNMAEL